MTGLKPEDPMANGKQTILLVEDEALIAMAEKMMLERNGYLVVTASTGEKAIAAVEENRAISLVLMDIDLGPGIDGTEAAEKILAERQIPVVFLSSHTEPAIVEKTEGITSYGYIVKNSGDTVLLASIRMAFRLYAAHRDIARQSMEMEATNETLRVTNERLQWWDNIVQYVIEHDPSAIAVLDADLRFMYVSESFMTDYRVADATIIGKHHCEVFPDAPERWREVHRRALAGETIRNDDDYLERPDGTVDYTRWECMPWYQPNGSVGGIILYSEVITERRRTERALASERERLAVTVQSIGDAVISTDVNGNVELMNAVASNLTGWTQDAARGRPLEEVFRIVDAGTRQTRENPVERVLREGVVFGLANHTILLSAGGAEYQIADSAAPIIGSTGEIEGVVLVFRDVTDEYAMAQALETRDREMRRAQQMANLGSWSMDLNDGSVTASDQTRRIYGIGDGPLTGAMVQLIHLPKYREPLVEAVGRLVANEAPYDVEFEIRRPSDGEIRTVHSIAEYDRETNRVVGTLQDVTDRKRVEEELRIEHERFATIADTSPVGITTVDPEGGITYANEAAERILGLSRDEITTRMYNEPRWRSTTADGDPLPDEEQPFTRVRESDAPVYDVRHAIEWPDGRRVLLSVSGSPVHDGDGNFAGMVAVIQDVTESEHVQRRVRELADEKELLLREAHHRVRNNMSTIYSLLSMHAARMTDTQCREPLEEAALRVRGMSTLYDTIYRQVGMSDMSVDEFLPGVVADMVSLLETTAPVETDVEVADIHLPAGTLSVLGIILNELITNSVKHCFSGAPDAAVSPRIALSVTADGDTVVVRYRDECEPGDSDMANGAAGASSGSGGTNPSFGTPPSETPSSDSASGEDGFGLHLIRALTAQLDGAIEFGLNGSTGSSVLLSFPRVRS
jgi:PAS domain S-box-containing protein